ncbi:hypothetical protein Tco_0636238 [Tanacetum coccineum]
MIITLPFPSPSILSSYVFIYGREKVQLDDSRFPQFAPRPRSKTYLRDLSRYLKGLEEGKNKTEDEQPHFLGSIKKEQKRWSREELYFSNTSNMKFINEAKDDIVTLQRVVKLKMSLNVNNWSSTVHQEVHKILNDEIALIINQIDARVINFEKQFLKEATKFVGDFKSLAKETDESLDMNKVLEYENERLLRIVISQDIMSIVQNNSILDTSNLQTERERTKEKLETCIIKKEN